MSGIKRTTADKHFSDAVRESFDFTCRSCGINGRHQPGMMDCSHVFSRKHRNTRWHPLNALCLCRSCHQKMSDRPPVHAELVRKVWGEEKYYWLIREHNKVAKIPKAQEKDIAKHYKAEKERVQGLRAMGRGGYIKINNWMDTE